MLGPLERYMTPTLDAALLISFRAGADLGRMSDSVLSCAISNSVFVQSKYCVECKNTRTKSRQT